MTVNGRGLTKVVCSCGGAPEDNDPTEQEERDHGCYRPACCVVAMVCPQCKTRWVFSMDPPEAD